MEASFFLFWTIWETITNYGEVIIAQLCFCCINCTCHCSSCHWTHSYKPFTCCSILRPLSCTISTSGSVPSWTHAAHTRLALSSDHRSGMAWSTPAISALPVSRSLWMHTPNFSQRSWLRTELKRWNWRGTRQLQKRSRRPARVLGRLGQTWPLLNSPTYGVTRRKNGV